jgi:putative flippase GtrA
MPELTVPGNCLIAHIQLRCSYRGAEQPNLNAMRVLQVDIVVPVRNEEGDLAPSVRRLVSYLRDSFPFSARITIADNGSTDATWAIASNLARELPEVRAIHMELPGRGRALRAIWSQSEAEILAYMDVDISTDLNALLPLVAPLLSGHSDLAIGTRLARGSRVVRGPRREIISRCYNLLLRAFMGARFSDAQCGFKAIRRDQARALLPLTQDTGWFFDTELLVLAERAGLRIHEIPVDWIDDLDSRVDIIATALADLRGMARLGVGFARGSIQVPQLRGSALAGAGARRASHDLPMQIARFTVIGVASTIAYVVLFLLLRTFMSAQAANVISLLVTAVANTAANRRLTFGISGRSKAARHQVKGLIAFGVGLALTSGALAALHAGSDHPGHVAEVSVLIAANLVATVIRFLLYRHWVFGGPKRPAEPWRDDREPVPPDPVEPFGSAVQVSAMTTQGETTS